MYLTLSDKNSPHSTFNCTKKNIIQWNTYDLHENENDVLIYSVFYIITFCIPSQNINNLQLADSWAAQLEQDN